MKERVVKMKIPAPGEHKPRWKDHIARFIIDITELADLANEKLLPALKRFWDSFKIIMIEFLLGMLSIWVALQFVFAH